MSTNDDGSDLEVIKRLLILLLLYEGATIRDIVKVTGMSSATLYKFLPKDIAKKRNISNAEK